MAKKIATEKAPAAIGPYSQAMVVGNLVFTSGQIAIDPAPGNIDATDVVGQTEQVMKNLGEVLAAAGAAVYFFVIKKKSAAPAAKEKTEE